MKEKFRIVEKSHDRGHFSHSIRLDPSFFQEYDLDTERTRKLWLEKAPIDPNFQDDIRSLLRRWRSLMQIPPSMDLHVFMTGQSHIDMAWLWRFEQTKQKGIKTLEKVIQHCQLLPNQFQFALSSPQLLMWVKEENPALWEQIREYVQKGQIELVGGSWVEPDCMMPSGEAMIRQRLYGMRFYWQEFERLPEVEWFLDSFGYNQGLPQILAKSGAKYFWTSKLTWNLQTVFPFVYFWWEGPDGSRLLTVNFGQNKESFESWTKFELGRHLLLPTGQREWSYRQGYAKLQENLDLSSWISDVGWFNGAGDGGHGPTHKEVAEMQMCVKLGPEYHMHFQWATVKQLFERLQMYGDHLPIWHDELYLETHQGTFSGHSYVKRHNRRLERRLQTVETLAALLSTAVSEFTYPNAQIERTWKIVLLNQFHDVLPGSCLPEVLDDVYETWKECDQILDRIIIDVIPCIHHESQDTCLFFNPLAWIRRNPVFIPITILATPLTLDERGYPPYARLKIKRGEKTYEYICQPIKAESIDELQNHPAGWWTIIEIPAFGILTGILSLETTSSSKLLVYSPESQMDPQISNEKITLTVDHKTGAIKSLTASKLNSDQNLLLGKRNLLIDGYLDQGGPEYPAWNLTPEYWKYPKNYDPTQNLSIILEDTGSIFSTLHISQVLGASPSDLRIRLYKNNPLITCLWSADWQEKDVMLKIGLETQTNAQIVSNDGMYCLLQPSSLPDSPADKARYEKITHTFVDTSTPMNTWGVALLNEGKYGFDANAGRIRITLHRSPQYPSPSAESWVKLEREYRKKKENTEIPTHFGLGPVSCRFGILPHKNGCVIDHEGKPSGGVISAAEEFNSPILVANFPQAFIENHSTSLFPFQFDLPKNVRIVALKRKEWEGTKSLILRIVEHCGIAETLILLQFPVEFTHFIDTIHEVDCLERPIPSSTVKWHSDTNRLQFLIHHWEIKTFELQMK